MVFRARQQVTRRPSDAWIGAAVLLALFSLVCYTSHIQIAALLFGYLGVIGIVGHVLSYLWLRPEHGLQRLACALLTFPVLMFYGIACAVAVFMTMWNTHVGHDFRLPTPKPGAETGV
jgi:hypothetical protein